MWRWSDPAFEVAPYVLGAVLHIRGVSLRITEVEAYAGGDDPASHAYRGLTRRNAAMFEAGGRLYCYLSHGIHTAVNLVCGEPGTPHGVLVRAGEVVDGADLARLRRGESVPDHRLARGPGCTGQTLGVTVDDSGWVLGQGGLEFTAPTTVAAHRAGPRVGVSRAADIAWRFWIPGDPTVSAYRRSPRAPEPAGGGFVSGS